MAKVRLTKRAVDAAKPAAKEYLLWDAELPGFGLRVYPSGRKVYLLQYKRRGETRKLRLGQHGPTTAEAARERARQHLAELDAGGDPAEARNAERSDPTVAELCELYLAEGADHLKASTRTAYAGAIRRHILPLLAKKRLRRLTQADVERFQRDVAAGKTARDERTGPRGRAIVRGGKVGAARATSYLAAILSFAVRRRLIDRSPAEGVKLYKAPGRERFLTDDELARIGAALAEAERAGARGAFVNAVRLLALTGCRKSEITQLTWAEVDTAHGCLRLKDSKTGRRVVPLGDEALELLESLPREGDYVLPATHGQSGVVGLQRFWSRLRARIGLEDVHLHDLRHTVASVAVAGGASLFLVGKVLGHRQSSMTERYAHVRNDPLRAVATLASGKVAAAMRAAPAVEPPPEGGKVVAFRGRTPRATG